MLSFPLVTYPTHIIHAVDEIYTKAAVAASHRTTRKCSTVANTISPCQLYTSRLPTKRSHPEQRQRTYVFLLPRKKLQTAQTSQGLSVINLHNISKPHMEKKPSIETRQPQVPMFRGEKTKNTIVHALLTLKMVRCLATPTSLIGT